MATAGDGNYAFKYKRLSCFKINFLRCRLGLDIVLMNKKKCIVFDLEFADEHASITFHIHAFCPSEEETRHCLPCT